MTKCNVPFSTDGAFTDVQVTPDTNTNPITSKKLDQTTADFPQAQGQRSWQRQIVLCVSFILYIIFKALLPEGFTGIQCWFSALPLMSRDFSVLLWIPCNRVLKKHKLRLLDKVVNLAQSLLLPFTPSHDTSLVINQPVYQWDVPKRFLSDSKMFSAFWYGPSVLQASNNNKAYLLNNKYHHTVLNWIWV